MWHFHISMQQHPIEFVGEGVTAKSCVIFEMMVDHGCGCAFCGRDLDLDDGRWVVFQCIEMTKNSYDYVEEQTVLVYICEDCHKHSEAFHYFSSNTDSSLLQNNSNKGLYKFEVSFSA